MSKPSILLVGIPMPPGGRPAPVKVAWSETPVSIMDEIKQVVPIMRDRGYTDFEVMGIAPRDLSTTLKDRISSKHWDAVVVGGGYRGIPELTEGLEDFVNIVKDTCPQTRVMFLSKGPLSVLETADRLESILSKR